MFRDLIKEVFLKLSEMKIDFIFSGAIAANVYRTTPRATADIDIAIPFNEQVLEAIKRKFINFEFINWDILKERLEIKKKYKDVIIPEFLRLKHVSGYEIDFFPLYSNYLLRKKKAKMLDFEIDVIGPEDLIIIKSIYYRPKDQDDIINILENSDLELDLNYLIQELQEFDKIEVINQIRAIRMRDNTK